MRFHLPPMSSGYEDALQKVRMESYAHIMAHERAHQAAAGQYGGGISIVYDAQGIAIAGSVPVSIPSVDVYNPNTSLQAGQTIKNAALAPSDPSMADVGVAAMAQRLISRSQQLISQHASFLMNIGAGLIK